MKAADRAPPGDQTAHDGSQPAEPGTRPPTTMKVAIYARVSTDEQSVNMQLDDLRQYAARRGWTITQEYVDEGYSGATAKRPALGKLVADSKRRKFDVVLVWRFDRFARSTQHLISALNEFRALGIGFNSYGENIDTTTPMGELVFTIFAALAQFERDIIRSRVVSGMRAAKARGVHLGRLATIAAEEVMAAREAGGSYRALAEKFGCSKTQVERICGELPKTLNVKSGRPKILKKIS